MTFSFFALFHKLPMVFIAFLYANVNHRLSKYLKFIIMIQNEKLTVILIAKTL